MFNISNTIISQSKEAQNNLLIETNKIINNSKNDITNFNNDIK